MAILTPEDANPLVLTIEVIRSSISDPWPGEVHTESASFALEFINYINATYSCVLNIDTSEDGLNKKVLIEFTNSEDKVSAMEYMQTMDSFETLLEDEFLTENVFVY